MIDACGGLSLALSLGEEETIPHATRIAASEPRPLGRRQTPNHLRGFATRCSVAGCTGVDRSLTLPALIVKALEQ